MKSAEVWLLEALDEARHALCEVLKALDTGDVTISEGRRLPINEEIDALAVCIDTWDMLHRAAPGEDSSPRRRLRET